MQLATRGSESTATYVEWVKKGALFLRELRLRLPEFHTAARVGYHGQPCNRETAEMTARAHPVKSKETALLSAEIDHALSLLDQADAPDRSTDTRLLINAAESYQRTKNLLLRMDLDVHQSTRVEERLAVLQARLLGKR